MTHGGSGQDDMTKMHDDEVLTTSDLVARLVAAQFPRWEGLPISRLRSSGTDNAMYRLGSDMVVRLPRIAWAAAAVEHEQRWLPHLGPLLPVATPLPLAMGEPVDGYPWPWSVYTWVDGVNPAPEAVTDQLVDDIAACLNAVHAVDTLGAPAARRDLTLAGRDEPIRASIRALVGMVDTDVLTRLWDEALQLSPCELPGVWIHGDVAPGNLLISEGRLHGLIDFSGCGLGDPSIDLGVAWNLFRAPMRPAFRAALEVNEATWLRGRAWAVSQACLQLPYYKDTNKPLAAQARHVIAEALADAGFAADWSAST